MNAKKTIDFFSEITNYVNILVTLISKKKKKNLIKLDQQDRKQNNEDFQRFI